MKKKKEPHWNLIENCLVSIDRELAEIKALLQTIATKFILK